MATGNTASNTADGFMGDADAVMSGTAGMPVVPNTIYGHAWPCMAVYGHAWPDMAIYGHPWPCLAMHGHAWPYMAIYGRPWPCMAMHGQTWPYMAMHGHIWPCLAMHDMEQSENQKSVKIAKNGRKQCFTVFGFLHS